MFLSNAHILIRFSERFGHSLVVECSITYLGTDKVARMTAHYASSRMVGNPETEIGLVANFRVARQNVAARAADASREANGAVVACCLR